MSNITSSTSTTHPAKARGLADKEIYSINDLTILHGLSRNTMIRLYENEPGVQVLHWKLPEKKTCF